MSRFEKIVATVVLSYLGIGIIIASVASFLARGWFDVDFSYFLVWVIMWPAFILRAFLGF